MEEKKVTYKYTQEDYIKVHNLAYLYKDGDKEAGEELINLFSALLNRYVSLLHYGYYDLKHSSIKNFIKLFVKSPTKRSTIGSYKYNNGSGIKASQETVDTIKSYFSNLSKEDIKQEIYNIFLVMTKKYKDTKPSFQNHINKNFHFYVFRHFEKHTKDPLSRGSCSSETLLYKNSALNQQNEGGDIYIPHIIKDNQFDIDIANKELEISIEQSLNNSIIPTLKYNKKPISILDDSFLDINWINGITCSEVFQTLTPFERKILIMWYIDKKTDSQIAEEFGLCRCTINIKRAKTKDKLEVELKRLNLSVY